MYKLKKIISVFLFLIFGLGLSGCNGGSDSDKNWTPETEGILAAAISNTGKYVLLGLDSGKANLWELKKKAVLQHSWQHQELGKGGIIAVALSDDDKYALTAEDNSVAWWDVANGKVLGYWKLDGVKSIALSKNGQFAIIGFRDYAQYFSLQTSQPIFKFEHPDFIKTAAISDDRRYAITGSDNAEARLWSLKNGELLHTWKYKTKLISVELSADGKYAMTNAVLEQTKVWSTESGKLLHKLGPRRITIPAGSFDSNGKTLVLGRGNQGIDLWTVKTGKKLEFWKPKKPSEWPPSSASVIAINFIDDDKKVLSITSSGIIQRWKIK